MSQPLTLDALGNLYLGHSQFATDPCRNGMLDDFRIYGHAMNTAELAPYGASPAALRNIAAGDRPTLTRCLVGCRAKRHAIHRALDGTGGARRFSTPSDSSDPSRFCRIRITR